MNQYYFLCGIAMLGFLLSIFFLVPVLDLLMGECRKERERKKLPHSKTARRNFLYSTLLRGEEGTIFKKRIGLSLGNGLGRTSTIFKRKNGQVEKDQKKSS